MVQVRLAFVALRACVSQASQGCYVVTAISDEGGSRSWPEGQLKLNVSAMKETQRHKQNRQQQTCQWPD